MSEETVELSEVESFSYLFKTLWEPEARKREICHILDTVLFTGGRPGRWLFTSNEGEVLKRKDENLNPFEILRVFKQKSKFGKGLKDHTLKTKIATVWFVNSKNSIQSYLVDDLQLKSILDECYNTDGVDEILAVQVYIGGYRMKGSGVFEHRYYMRKNNQVAYQTNELVSVLGNDVTTYSSNADRLHISESQHDSIKTMARRLARKMEQKSKGKVANVVFQVVFSSSWVPFLVCCRASLLWHPDMSVTLYRSEVLHALPPPLPPNASNHGSILLPHSRGNDEAGLDFGFTQYTSSQTFRNSQTTKEREELHEITDVLGVDNRDHDLPSHLHDHLHELGEARDEVLVPVSSSHSHHNKKKKNRANGPTGIVEDEFEFEEMMPTFQQPDEHMDIGSSSVPNPKRGPPGSSMQNSFPSSSVDYDDQDLLFKDSFNAKPTKGESRFLNGAGKRPLSASATGVHYPAGLGGDSAQPVSSGGVGGVNGVNGGRKMSVMMGALAAADAADTAAQKATAAGVRGSRRTGQGAVPAMSSGLETRRTKNLVPSSSRDGNKAQNRGAIHKNAAYAMTNSSKTKLEFYRNQLKVADSLPLEKFLNNRRPISAPHGARGIHGGDNHLDGAHGVKNSHGVGVPLGGHGEENGGRAGSGFEKKAPLTSGCVCFGDYCFLGEFTPTRNETGGFNDMNEGSLTFNPSGAPKSPKGSPPSKSRSESPANVPGGGGGGPTLMTAEQAAKDAEEKGGRLILKSEMDDRDDGGNAASERLANTTLYGTNRVPFKEQANGHGMSAFDLRAPQLPFQLPFRSVLLLRAEENFLKTKLYESWEGDDFLSGNTSGAGNGPPKRVGGGGGGEEDSNSSSPGKAEFAVENHDKKLLDLTKRHLKRIGYVCLADVKKTVVAMPALHATDSGFQMQWDNLSHAYRRLVYTDALSKAHPSRFYQTVPMCSTCQFVYVFMLLY